MRRIVILLLITSKLFGQTNFAEQVFTVQQLQEDFRFFREKLETHNTNLYLYNDKKTIDQKFDELYNGINHEMTSTQFYDYINSIQPTIKDCHNLILPSTTQQDYFTNNALYFPLNFVEYYGKLFITQNFSNDTSIQNKDEILTINGKPANDIFEHIVNRQPRDGNNLNYPKYVVETYFRSYYGFMFGFCKEFNLSIKSADGTIANKTIDALPLATIKKRRIENSVQRYDRISHKKGIEWNIDKENKNAYLFISHWTKKQMKKDFGLNFKTEFNRFFEEVELNNVKSIIIDLRGNQGGDSDGSIAFLQHILNKPFNYFYSVQKYNKKGKLVSTARWLYRTYKPLKTVFNGNIYVLSNGGTCSNSSIFCEVIRKYNRGKIIGTETGGCGTILSGSGISLELPNTKINVSKITHRMVTINSNPNNGQGAVPDIIIEPTLEQILNNDDVVLKQALDMCNEK